MDEFRIVKVNQSRRTFLKAGVAAGAALTLAVYVRAATAQRTATSQAVFEPNAFVRIGKDNTVTVIIKHLEMGQGTYTGLATLVAEELDASWAQIRVEGAPADAKRYNNLLWGPMQGTGGSSAIANSFEQMRQAGAAARAMLVAVAAKRWKVAPESINVKDGIVQHASGKKASFGELAADAAAMPAGPPPSTTTGCSRVMSAPRFGASGGVVSVMSVSSGLLIEDGAVRNAARAAVVVGSPPDGLQRAIGGQRSEDRAPLRGAPADQLRPRRLPTLRALGQRTHEEKLLTGLQTSNERSER